jgi:hypothetical protein
VIKNYYVFFLFLINAINIAKKRGATGLHPALRFTFAPARYFFKIGSKFIILET